MNIIKTLGNFIRFEFSYSSGKSVATITADLQSTVKELEAHAAEQIKTMQAKTLAAAKLLKERAQHEEEHMLASKTAQNIKALLG